MGVLRSVPGILGGVRAPYRLVANRTGYSSRTVANSGAVGGGTATQAQNWYFIYITDNCTELNFLYGNFRANASTPSQLDTGASQATIRLGVRHGAGGAAIAATTDGTTRDLVLASGAYGTLKALGTFTQGETLVVQQFTTFASVPSTWPLLDIIMSQFGEFNEFGTSLTDRTLATSWTGGTRVTNYPVLPPILVYAPVSGPKRAGIMLLGDSISAAGSSDFTFGEYIGWAPRGLTNTLPWFINGASGASYAGMMSNSTQVQRRFDNILNLVKLTSLYGLCGFGTNDLASLQTAAQMLTWQGNMKTKLTSFGYRLIPIKLQPRTNSANNALPASEPNTFTNRQSFNSSMVSNNGCGFGYFDMAASSQDSVSTDLWRTDLGTPTADGIHPSTVVHTQAAADFAAVLGTLFPGY